MLAWHMSGGMSTFIRMYLCVCIYIYTCIYINTYIHTYIYIHIHIYVYTHMHTCIFMYNGRHRLCARLFRHSCAWQISIYKVCCSFSLPLSSWLVSLVVHYLSRYLERHMWESADKLIHSIRVLNTCAPITWFHSCSWYTCSYNVIPFVFLIHVLL